jgi:hypothetical protein
MYKVKRFSKLYDQAKARYDRQEDYDIADIAAKKAELPGKILGTAAGLGVGAIAGKKMTKYLDKNKGRKLVKLANNYGISDAITSKLTLLGAASLGSNLGAQATSSATRKAILEEAEDRRRNPEKYKSEEEKSRLINIPSSKRKKT